MCLQGGNCVTVLLYHKKQTYSLFEISLYYILDACIGAVTILIITLYIFQTPVIYIIHRQVHTPFITSFHIFFHLKTMIATTFNNLVWGCFIWIWSLPWS